MATSETPSAGADATRDRRAARRERTHRRRRQAFAVAAAIVVVSAGAAVATDTVRLGGDDGPTLAEAVRAPGAPPADSSTTTTTTIPSRPCRSDLTNTEPLKVWVGGDSLAGALGPAFGTIAGATGVVQPYFHSRVSSGLGNPGFVNWPSLAAKEMASVSPEIVVFIISTNDYGVPLNTTVDTSTGEVAWKGTYRKQVEEVLQSLAAPERTILWLGAPVLKDTMQNDGVKALNEVEREVVGKHPDAEFFDTYALFADRDGRYTSTVTDDSGKVIMARSGDGVHFTPEGATFLANAVYKVIDKQCKVTTQAVTGKTLSTIQTPGSTQVAPSSGGTGGSVGTTPPASSASSPTTTPSATTAPPATTPPTDSTTTTAATQPPPPP